MGLIKESWKSEPQRTYAADYFLFMYNNLCFIRAVAKSLILC